MRTYLARNRSLAIFIFVLWALGVVVVPAVSGPSPLLSDPTLSIVVALYFVLRLAGLAFVLWLCGLLAREIAKRRAAPARAFWQAVLYLYVLVTLCVSIAITVSAGQW